MKRIRGFLSFFLIFLGLFIYFVTQNPHFDLVNTGSNHLLHGQVEIPEEYVIPSIKLHVNQDLSGTWLLKVETENFTFAPEKVGESAPSYNEGHAHLYINGKKINRLYGNYYNLDSLKEGENKIKVSLHSNNHGALVFKGKAIERTIKVDVPS